MSEKSSPWPDGYSGALSLTFDDGSPSQLKKAIPILNDLGFGGTFFVCPRGDDWMDKLSPWRRVFESGHEIGNHTISHTCSRALSPAPNKRCLENMTLGDVEADIVEASKRIRILIPEQESFTFCYPCYNNHVGEGSTRQSYVPIVAKHFPAGRGVGEFPFGNYPATCDLHYLWSWPVEGKSGVELTGLAERTAAFSQWGIMTFHSIDEGRLSVPQWAFRELCEFLDRHRERIWVAPMITVALRIIEWRKTLG
ncbi:polysaccharide deacetylase family protein [Candidatus Poribacteria bacterium]